jgi:hypothetical protein
MSAEGVVYTMVYTQAFRSQEMKVVKKEKPAKLEENESIDLHSCSISVFPPAQLGSALGHTKLICPKLLHVLTLSSSQPKTPWFYLFYC